MKHVLAKSRIAPLKKKTIPKLELMAAVLATKIKERVTSALMKKIDVTNIYYWCDSEIVLHWILGKPATDCFVRRRVEVIKSASKGCSWRYVPSKMNPSDVISRGTTMNVLIDSHWNNGPDWLIDEKLWPDVNF